jgi:integrase
MTITAIHRKIDSIITHISRQGFRYPKNTLELVLRTVKDAFTTINGPIFSKQDTKHIQNKLTKDNDPDCRESVVNFACYNDLAAALNKSRKIELKFINIPRKAKRHLILHIDRLKLNQINQVQIIRDELDRLRSPQLPRLDNTMKKEFLSGLKLDPHGYLKGIIKNSKKVSAIDFVLNELDLCCSFVASAAISGLMVFPKFHSTLLRLRVKNISIYPVSTKIYFKNSGTFYRFFLPFPASAYFLRYLLYYENQYRKLFGRKTRKLNDLINQVSFYDHDQFALIFRRWTQCILSAHGIQHARGLTPVQFYKSALAAALLQRSRSDSYSTSLPPFILAAQSMKIKSYCLSDRYMVHLANIFSNRSATSQSRKKKKARRIGATTSLEQAIQEIANIRMRLETHRIKTYQNQKYITTLVKWQPPHEARKIAAQEIMQLVVRYQTKLNHGDYFNINLYAKWVASMLINKRLKNISSINDYASMVPTLLYLLSDKGAIHHVAPNVFDECLSATIRQYGTPAIVKHLKLFCAYVGKELNKRRKIFVEPNWKKDDQKKEEIRSPKALISFNDLDEALLRCESFFSRYVKRFKSPDVIRKHTANAHHKIKVYRLIIILAFFTGLRISEIVRLTIHNVTFDEGMMLTVRVSKTRNGIRNIPVNLLLPEKYLSEFRDHVNALRKYWTAFLFSKKSESLDHFNQSTAGKDILALFDSLGYKEFVFHHFRHSFANWFLLRWFAAFHGEKVPPDSPFLKYDLFQPFYLDKLRTFMIGFNNSKGGRESFSYALATLARLMGHGGPVITLETYIHNTDWLFYLLSKYNEPKSMTIKGNQAQNFLQVTYPTFSVIQRRSAEKILSEPQSLLYYQRQLLPRRYHQ